MSDRLHESHGNSGAGHLSRSAIGRMSGAVSRLFGGTSTMRVTGRFLRRQLWAWPIIAAVLFGGAGWWVNQSVESAMQQQRAADLNAMADASASAVRVWMGEQCVNVKLITDDEQLRAPVAELLRLADGTPAAERQLVQARAQEALRARLKSRLQVCGYVGFLVVSPAGIVVAS